MNLLKSIPFLVSILFTKQLYAQKNEPVILKLQKENHHKKMNNEKDKGIYFLQFGIMAKNHKKFEEKYGLSIVYENCVITSYMSEKAKKNNLKTAQYLTEKYGESWKKDLEIIPYGL